MATSGFPWTARPITKDLQEPEILNEKFDPEVSGTNGLTGKPLSDITNKNLTLDSTTDEKRHTSVHGKHRHGSLRASTAMKHAMKLDIDGKSGKDKPDRPPVRTIPPWVRDVQEDDIRPGNISLMDSPDAAFLAHHNHAPSDPQRPFFSNNEPKSGQFPTSSGALRPERTSRWISFARASAYPRETFKGEQVDKEWLDQYYTDYSQPWLAGHNDDDDDDEEDGSARYRAFRKKRQVWYKRSQFTILRNPFIPLVFRMLVFTFAVVAIGLGASIYVETGKIVKCIKQDDRNDFCQDLVGTGDQDYYRDPSALMAVIVDVIAVVYTLYITYDEYFSKPLGLRRARAKVRLVLLDLFFIVFQSANLSLSFESLTVDEGACQVGDEPRTSVKFDNVCDRAEALSSVLLLSLIAWLMTFSVSVLRLVERIDTRTG